MTAPANLVPPAVAALYSTALGLWPTPTADPAAGVDVFLGPPIGRLWAPRGLAIACSWAEELEPISTSRQVHGAGQRTDEETAVACFFYVGGGASDGAAMLGYRAIAANLLGQLDDALLHDATLRATVALARREGTRWVESRDEGAGKTGIFADFVVNLTTLD